MDPYSKIIVGVSKNRQDKEIELEKRWWVNQKCASCDKGFNGMSKHVRKCHSCDRYTHGRKPCSVPNSADTMTNCNKCKTKEPTKKLPQEQNTNQNIFQCDKCNIRFTEKLNMLRHMKQRHGGTEGTEVPTKTHEEPLDTFTENKMKTFEEVLNELRMEEHVESFQKEKVTIEDVLK